MVTMQVNTPVRSIAMLQRRLHSWRVGWRSCAACRGKDLSCGTTRSTGCTYKSSGMLPIGDQQVAAIRLEGGICKDEPLATRLFTCSSGLGILEAD